MGKGSKRKTRHELLEEHESILTTLPDIEDQFIISMMHECGWYNFGANGLIPISWTELHAWSSQTATAITPTESLLMMNLSKVYVGQYNSSDDRNEPAPYTTVPANKADISDKIKAILSRNAKSSK